MAGIRYKASTDYVTLIERYLSYLGGQGLVFRDIMFRGEPIAAAGAIRDYFYALDRSNSIANRLRLTAEWLLGLLKEREASVRGDAWVDEEVELLDKETYLKAYQSLRSKKVIQALPSMTLNVNASCLAILSCGSISNRFVRRCESLDLSIFALVSAICSQIRSSAWTWLLIVRIVPDCH